LAKELSSQKLYRNGENWGAADLVMAREVNPNMRALTKLQVVYLTRERFEKIKKDIPDLVRSCRLIRVWALLNRLKYGLPRFARAEREKAAAALGPRPPPLRSRTQGAGEQGINYQPQMPAAEADATATPDQGMTEMVKMRDEETREVLKSMKEQMVSMKEQMDAARQETRETLKGMKEQIDTLSSLRTNDSRNAPGRLSKSIYANEYDA